MQALSKNQIGILMVAIGMVFISINDVLIKALSGDYPLHQIVFVRSFIGMLVCFLVLRFEGGWTLLKTKTPGLHFVRALLLVVANMTYFVGLSVMPLALAAALFFVAPLLITLLSIPFLGEQVGRHRWAAVFVGFLGVVVMLVPELTGDGLGVPLWTYALPLLAALTYAGTQILTRKLGLTTSASALAIYIQGTFLLVSISFFAIAGDGRFAENLTNPSLQFLLRAWVMPPMDDWWVFGLIGVLIAGVAYTLSQAYRMGEAGVVAPFEYIALPLAVLWGYSFFGEVPGPFVWAGIALVLGSGLYVVWRERISTKRD